MKGRPMSRKKGSFKRELEKILGREFFLPKPIRQNRSAHKRFWVLGASDPEMSYIENSLVTAGEHIGYATMVLRSEHVRVGPGQAYQAMGIIDLDRNPIDLPSGRTIYFVECAMAASSENLQTVIVDHHRPGDPGYGKPPAEFWKASSIGQVVELLHMLGVMNRVAGALAPGISSSGDKIFAAAADHCLEAAYRGKCPGVNPELLMEWRVKIRAAHQGRRGEDILRDVNAARQTLQVARRIVIGNVEVADLRGVNVPECPEASAREGIPFLGTPLSSKQDPRRKVNLLSAPPDAVQAFIDSWAPAHGLVDIYGDPARGFAGGYIPN